MVKKQNQRELSRIEAGNALLDQTAAKHGGEITPEQVVELAEDPNSPLHPDFEWDDSQAAHQYRLDQARTVIRRYKVSVKVKHRQLPVMAPAFVRNPASPSKEAGYISIAQVRTDDELARDVLVQEFSRAAAAIRRARLIAKVLELEGAVDELLEQIEGITAHVRAGAEGQLPA